jgi:hypothetical protein
MITTAVAFFAFGYCITDMVLRYRANQRINQFVRDLDKSNNLDD